MKRLPIDPLKLLLGVVLPAASLVGVAAFAGLLFWKAHPAPRTIPEPPSALSALVPPAQGLVDVAAPADPAQHAGWMLARQSNANAGAGGGIACSVCHGIDGSGRIESGIPRLAGLDSTYIAKQLRDYQAGTRTHFTMQAIAKSLSSEDVDAAAAYFSSLPAKGPVAAHESSRVAALGTWIAQNGVVEKGVAACGSCHGKDGVGTPPIFPRLQGQPSMYLESQLAAFRSGARANDSTGIMKTIATALTPAEAHAVGAYYQSLGQLAPQPVLTAAR